MHCSGEGASRLGSVAPVAPLQPSSTALFRTMTLTFIFPTALCLRLVSSRRPRYSRQGAAAPLERARRPPHTLRGPCRGLWMCRPGYAHRVPRAGQPLTLGKTGFSLRPIRFDRVIAKGALLRGVVCWRWRRSTKVARVRRRPASAGSVCRRSGLGAEVQRLWPRGARGPPSAGPSWQAEHRPTRGSGSVAWRDLHRFVSERG